MSEYIVKLPTYGAADEFFKTHEMPDMTLYSYQLTGEIVRCRDCVHYKPYRTDKHGIMNRCHDEHGHTHKRDESDFCSRGERREQ